MHKQGQRVNKVGRAKAGKKGRSSRKRLSGSLTVFFALLFLSFVAFFVALLYLAGHYAAKSEGQRAVDLSAASVLAEYDRHLEKKYGLYAVNGASTLKDRFNYYIGENTADPGFLGLSPVAAETETLEANQTLAEPAVLEQEIRDFMELRIFIAWGEDLNDMLHLFGDEAKKVAEHLTEITPLMQYNSEYETILNEVRGDATSMHAKNLDPLNGFWEDFDAEKETETMKGAAERGDFKLAKKESKRLAAQLKKVIKRYEGVKKCLGKMKTKASKIDAAELVLNQTQIAELTAQTEKILAALKELKQAAEYFGKLSADTATTEPESPTQKQDSYTVEEAVKALKKAVKKMKSTDGVLQLGGEAAKGTYVNLSKLWKKALGDQIVLKNYAEKEDKFKGKESLYQNLPSVYYDVKGELWDSFWDAFEGGGSEGASEQTLPSGEPAGLDGAGGLNEEDISSVMEWLPNLAEKLADAAAQLADGIVAKACLSEYAEGMLMTLRENIAITDGKATAGVFNLRAEEKEHGFFTNEAEYLLKGSGSELKNVKAAYRRIYCLRLIGNMAALLSSGEKMDKIRSTAEAARGVGNGIGEVVVYAGLFIGWSMWETSVDLNDLLTGGRVPLWKTDADWRTDLDAVWRGPGHGSGITDKEEEKGISYEQYLKFLLALQPKLLLERRLQDLIYLDNGGRSLTEFAVGFSVSGSFRAGHFRYPYEANYAY